MAFQMPPLHLTMNTRSGDVAGHVGYADSVLDGSGWTVNYRTTGTASGAIQARPSALESTTAQVGGIPWLLIIAGAVAWKMAQN